MPLDMNAEGLATGCIVYTAYVLRALVLKLSGPSHTFREASKSSIATFCHTFYYPTFLGKVCGPRKPLIVGISCPLNSSSI
uniref:Secreted protein n=1 Tax=Steinernema glaseri TaxID=37863 RepID=A0A1I7ZF69_9BILA